MNTCQCGGYQGRINPRWKNGLCFRDCTDVAKDGHPIREHFCASKSTIEAKDKTTCPRCVFIGG